MNSSIFKHNPNLYWIIVGSLHLLVMGLLYSQFGLSTENEGAKYLHEAQLLVDGHYPKTFNYDGFFSAYVLYLTLFLFLKVPVTCIFLFSYALSIYSYLKFYSFLKANSSDYIAKLWLSFMLLSPMLLYWNCTLFSEPFYIAMSLLFIAVLFNKKGRFKIMVLFFIIPILIFSRPSSVFTILIMILYYLYSTKKIALKTSLYIGLGFLLLLFFVVFCWMPLSYNMLTYEITSGSVYCGFTTLSITTLPVGKYTLLDCYIYIQQHYGFKMVIELFIKKWISFFNLIRMYYSNAHNVFNGIHSLFYAFGLIGIYHAWKEKTSKGLFCKPFVIIILLNSLLIALTFNEWSERHTIEIFPYLFVLAAFGIDRCVSLVRK